MRPMDRYDQLFLEYQRKIFKNSIQECVKPNASNASRPISLTDGKSEFWDEDDRSEGESVEERIPTSKREAMNKAKRKSSHHYDSVVSTKRYNSTQEHVKDISYTSTNMKSDFLIQDKCPSQFSMGGNSACTVISIIASYEFLKYGNVDLVDYKKTQSRAITLWSNCQLGFCSAREALSKRDIASVLKGMVPLDSYQGELARQPLDIPLTRDGKNNTGLDFVLSNMSMNNGRIAAVVTCGGSTISIYQREITITDRVSLEEREFWIFDSHGINGSNYSSLLHIKGRTNLVKYVTKWCGFNETNKRIVFDVYYYTLYS